MVLAPWAGVSDLRSAFCQENVIPGSVIVTGNTLELHQVPTNTMRAMMKMVDTTTAARAGGNGRHSSDAPMSCNPVTLSSFVPLDGETRVVSHARRPASTGF